MNGRIETAITKATEAFMLRFAEELNLNAAQMEELALFDAAGSRIKFGQFGDMDVVIKQRLDMVALVEENILTENDLTEDEMIHHGFRP